MNIFEFAMKMEEDGRKFYLEHAAKQASPHLKRILEELADDERKHYAIFKSLNEGLPAEFERTRETKILSSVRNVFETLKSERKELSFPPDAQQIWEQAREIEKKSEDFYRQKAGEVTLSEQKQILNRIADEEHKHWVTVESVIKFLDRPRHWLEDAEWSNLEEY
ncbi:MAG TPA: ferritin family protein [Candidatus Deferrimicrobium sp.]|nr:ferritin family protein [Candidatus Deferrimicrobium sp.]